MLTSGVIDPCHAITFVPIYWHREGTILLESLPLLAIATFTSTHKHSCTTITSLTGGADVRLHVRALTLLL